MPSFADVAKYMVPALAGIAGAVNPRTADALNDIVSMRQAFKDRERRVRREDESDRLAQLREERAAEEYDIKMGEYAREREKRAETDATIGGLMRTLPSRYTEDPVVMAMANQGDVAGIMKYVEDEIQGRGTAANMISLIAQNQPAGITPELKDLIRAEPRSFLTGLQALSPQLMKRQDPTLTMEDIAGLNIPPDAYVSGKVDIGGAPVTVSRQGAQRGGTPGKLPEHLDPVVVTRRTNDYLNIVNDLVSEYQSATGMSVSGPRGKRDDPKLVKARSEKIDEIRKRYLKERADYMKSTEKWPEEYRAPAVSWDKLISDGGLKWSMPTTDEKETKRDVSESDTAKERSGVTGQVTTRESEQSIADSAFLNWIKNKMETGDTSDLTQEHFDRYWLLMGGGE